MAGGKRISDALAKTVPICDSHSDSISNNVIICNNENESISQHYALSTLPSIVTRSEHDRIKQRLPSFLASNDVDFNYLQNIIRKPLRPIWLTPQSRLWNNDPPTYNDAPFIQLYALQHGAVPTVQEYSM
ncbi:initiator tRNA phosphoribosyl transferase-domain-containing protein [Syncephalis fuscata]|nr:initiator tRNA phosphoribosyl transferase-domain-containing protein [Syncephalis fuscata]